MSDDGSAAQGSGARIAGVRMRDIGLVAVGGTVGSLLRYLLTIGIDGARVYPAASGDFPLATCIINVLGAWCLGLLLEAGIARDSLGWHKARLLLGTGVLGGFTTYSLLAVDTAQLLLAGGWPLAMIYGLGTLIAGLLASWLGILTGSVLARSRARARRGSGHAAGEGAQ